MGSQLTIYIVLLRKSGWASSAIDAAFVTRRLAEQHIGRIGEAEPGEYEATIVTTRLWGE
jgi:hypothetical protein